MSAVLKALWFIESHSRRELDLEQVARASCISRYHLSRAFAEVYGVSIMRYVRLRRLSESAKRLAAGAPDILSIALENGYGSHEAFSRAFKKEFGVTPETVRSNADLSSLNLTEAIVMTTPELPPLELPRVEFLNEMTFVGLVQRYDRESLAGIPNQWQRFTPLIRSIPNQVGYDSFGVRYNLDEDGNFDYMSGVPVRGEGDYPTELVQLKLPAQKYAVFSHKGHLSEVRSVVAAIWSGALSESGYEPAEGAMLAKFCQSQARPGQGGFEIWVAVE